MLTDEDCLRPVTKRTKRADGQGLRLVVTPRGGRTWELALRVDGVPKTLALGSYPETGILDARAKAAAVRAKAARGEDPMASGRAARVRAAAVERGRRFDAVASDWYQRRILTQRDAKYAARIWTRVSEDLLPAIGDMDVAAITPADILRALQAVEGRGAIYSAKRIGGYARDIFAYARITHGVAINPAEGLRAALLPNPKEQGQPALTPSEVAGFYAAMDRPHADSRLTRIALELTMHTVLRSGELRGGRWPEVSGADWAVPASRMKAGLAHTVPLSTQARALLEELRAISGGGAMMFPGPRPGKTLSVNTVLFAIYGLGFRGKASGHGWRATFSTWAHATGRWDSLWIEACLAHQDKNQVRAAYNRGDFLAQRVEIMQAWSDWLDEQRAVAHLL